MTISVDAEDKLSSIQPINLSRTRRRELTSPLTSIEQHNFASINSSVGWLGITTSLFCSEFASRFQQLAPCATVKTIIDQSRYLHTIQKLGSYSYYPRFDDNKDHCISLCVFCDAGRSLEAGQISTLSGLVFDDIAEGSMFHVLGWSSHKARRPVKSTAAAEILAASEAIDDGKMLARTLSYIYKSRIELVILLDSKDLYNSLSTQRNSVDKSVRDDVNYIRYDFECGNVSTIFWVPGKINLADPGTKPDSPLCEQLQITLNDGKISVPIKDGEFRRFDRSLG